MLLRKQRANTTVHFMEMVRIASTANATHATMASNEINQVMLDPMPKDAPGLCTSVNERMPGITRTVCPSASADCAHPC